MQNEYAIRGFDNRKQYLEFLAQKFNVTDAEVMRIASLFGSVEDFTGLPQTLSNQTGIPND